MGLFDFSGGLVSLTEEEKKKQQQAQIWQDTMTSRAARKITNGIDPALANVKEPTLSKAKRIAGQFGLGVLQGASDLGKSHGAQVPDLRTGLKTDVGFQVSPEEMSSMENRIGAKNTTAEKISRGFGEFVPGLTLGGGLNKAAGLTKLAGESGAAYKKLLGDKLLGKAAESATKQLPDMLTTWGLMEGPKAQEERTSLPIWAAQWAGSDLALKGIGKGLKVGVGKLGSKAIKTDLPEVKPTEPAEEISLDSFFNAEHSQNQAVARETKPNIFKEMQDNGQLPFKPTGTNTLLAGMRKDWQTPVAERSANPNRNVDMASLPDKYPLPDVSKLEGKALAARARTETPALPEPTANWEKGTGYPNGKTVFVDPYGVARKTPGTSLALGEGLKTSPKINLQGKKGNITYPSENVIKEQIQADNPLLALKRERNADVDALNRAKGGLIKARYAPQAMEKPEFQVANAMAEANTGKSIIPVDRFDNAGATFGDKVFVNAKTKQPVLYVTNHEVIHTLETTAPESHARLMQIVKEHIADQEGITQHYLEQGYGLDDVHRELTSDTMAEVMLQPNFWSRVRAQSPELLKPILDAIDKIVANFKAKVGDDMTVLPYLKDVETMRTRLADEYQGYLADIKAGKIQKPGEGVAAKQELSYKLGEQGKSKIEEIKDMVLDGAKGINKTVNFADWKNQMLKKFPQVADEAQADNLLKVIYAQAEKLNKGTDVNLSLGGEKLFLTRADLQPVGKLPGMKNNAATGQASGNTQTKTVPGLISHIENVKKTSKYNGNEAARTARISELEAELKDLQKNPKYKDITGWQAETTDAPRIFKDFFGKDVELEEGSILDRLNQAKGANMDYQKMWTDKLKSEVVDKLGISKNTKLSKLVQQFGEGEITLAELKQKAPKKWEQVIEADKWFRNAYDAILDDVNRVIKEIYPNQADKLVPKRKDYYRHFKDLEGFSGFQKLIGSPANISPELAGRSQFVKPKTKWASFKQQRGMGEFKRDAVGGFLDYLPASSYSVNVDPMIKEFRQLSDELAKETSKTGEANTFIRYLQDYANSLAGKTSGWDRKLQETMEGKGGSRTAMNIITWLNNRAKSNAVMLNIGSALSQTLNIPNGIAFAKQYSIPGIGKALLGIFKEDAARASSVFMKERFSGKMYRQFDTKLINQPKNLAAWILETADRLGTEFIWQSSYSKGKALKEIAEPVKYADAMTKRLVAGRGIGELPLIQQSKLFQVVAPFTVEVANLWKVQKDFISAKDFGGLITLYVGLHLANDAMEKVRGQRVVFDPIQAIIEASKEIANKDNSPKQKAMKSVGRLAGEVLSNVPLGQTIAAAYPEYGIKEAGLPTRKELFGREDPTRFGTGPLFVKALQDPKVNLLLPMGGQQLKKTVNGIQSLNRSGYIKNNKLRYPVDSNSGANALKGLLFGASAFNEAQDYYNNNRRPLTEKQTKQYKQLINAGYSPEKAYKMIRP